MPGPGFTFGSRVFDASQITSGTLSADRLPESEGGAAVRKEFAATWSQTFGITTGQTDQAGVPPHTAGSGTSTAFARRALRASSVTALVIELNTASTVTAGSLTAKLFVDGSFVTGAQVVMTSGHTARALFAPGTYAVAQGARVEVRWTTTGDYSGPSEGVFLVELTEDAE